MRTLAALVACIYLSGCATTSNVLVQSEADPLQRGDNVKVTMQDGSLHVFQVDRISDDAVCSPSECLAKGEIASVERTRVDIGRTIGAVLLGAAVVALLVGIAAIHSGGVGFPPGAFGP